MQTEQPVLTPVTGTAVVEMEAQQAKDLRNALDGVDVIRDQPLELIRPSSAATAVTTTDPSDLWHLSEIGLSEARKSGFEGSGAGVTVAVMDTGIQADHVEFSGKGIDMVAFDVNRWTTTVTRPSLDTQGHGTHVAGLIAGQHVGVAPGAALINAVMIPNGHGWLSQFVLALEWAAANPQVAIVNMSAGIPGFVNGMQDAVNDVLQCGLLPVIAAGNEGRNSTRSPGNYRPVLSVGACNKHKAVSSFSSSGTLSVDNQIYRVPDLVAPGEAVTSCVKQGGYHAWDGTSMATPIVSGVAALILERYPDISVADLMDALIDTCIDLRISVERQGAGLVQVTAAGGADLSRLSGTGVGASRPMRRTRKSPTKKKTTTRKAKGGSSDDTHGNASA